MQPRSSQTQGICWHNRLKERSDTLKIAYMSITGNVKSFLKHIDTEGVELIEISDNINPKKIDDKYLLVIPTYDEYMTESIVDFIEMNGSTNCIGMIGSGNKNFGEDGYIFTAKDIKSQYGIPILHDFEYGGLFEDYEIVNKIIHKNK